MAIFLDRKELNHIFAAAANIRRRFDSRPQEREATIYLVRTMKGDRKPTQLGIQAFKTMHAAAIQGCGGHTYRDKAEGLVGVFDKPLQALRAALHALHATDLSGEMLALPPGRVAIAQGQSVVSGSFEVSGKGYDRAARLLSRAESGEVVLEPNLLRTPLTGYHDITADEPRSAKMPGLGTVTTVAVRPLGLKRDLDEELEAMDAELRARPSR